jgi:hypothetical protein
MDTWDIDNGKTSRLIFQGKRHSAGSWLSAADDLRKGVQIPTAEAQGCESWWFQRNFPPFWRAINGDIWYIYIMDIYLSVCLSTYLPIYLSIYPSIYVSMYPCIHLYFTVQNTTKQNNTSQIKAKQNPACIHAYMHASTHPYIHTSIHR